MAASLPCGGEDTHQLLERFERLAEFKLDVHVGNVLKIRGKGREMVWIIPVP